MYYYIEGIITRIEDSSIILENNGIGYIIKITNTNSFFVNQKTKIFTYFYVREHINCLYGFVDEKILFFFEKLIMIPGIGPKIAVNLANYDFLFQIQKNIKNNDFSELTKFNGVGKKTAQQIILHFKNNPFIDKEKHDNNLFLSQKKLDLKTALSNLGFLKKETEFIWNKLDFNKELEILIKDALSFISKK
jgi:Holliday junction DNA helicase RuvA